MTYMTLKNKQKFKMGEYIDSKESLKILSWEIRKMSHKLNKTLWEKNGNI